VESILYGTNRQSPLARIKRHWYTAARHATPRKVWNLALISAQYWMRRPVVKGWPVILKVEPTSRCNLACKGCAAHGMDFPLVIGDMKLETFQKLVDEVGPYLFKMSLYITGEPLINRNVYKMIRYATDHNIGTVISTNFHPFNEARAAEMIDSGLSHIVVCLDGSSQETYASYRVNGDVNLVLKNLEILKRAKEQAGTKLPFLEIQTVRLPQNQHEMPEIERIAREMGADRLTVRADFREYTPAGHDQTCFWLWYTALVAPDGAVTPCCPATWSTDARRYFGSTQETSFAEIWNGPSYVKARRVFGRDRSADMSDSLCFGCDIFRTPATIASESLSSGLQTPLRATLGPVEEDHVISSADGGLSA